MDRDDVEDRGHTGRHPRQNAGCRNMTGGDRHQQKLVGVADSRRQRQSAQLYGRWTHTEPNGQASSSNFTDAALYMAAFRVRLLKRRMMVSEAARHAKDSLGHPAAVKGDCWCCQRPTLSGTSDDRGRSVLDHYLTRMP